MDEASRSRRLAGTAAAVNDSCANSVSIARGAVEQAGRIERAARFHGLLSLLKEA